MPAPISAEIRAAIVRAREERGLTYEQIAELLGVGRATVSRVLRLRRETGTVEPRPPKGGWRSPIAGKVITLLQAIVTTMPDATVAELTAALQKRARVSTSDAAVGRVLKRLGYTRKKRASSLRSATHRRRASGGAPSARG